MKCARLGIALALLWLAGGCQNAGRHACSSCGPNHGVAGGSTFPGAAAAEMAGGYGNPGAAQGYCGPPAGAVGGHVPLLSATPDYISRMPHGDRPMMGGPPTGAYAYPYYTTRGPRDFLLDNPPTIGR